MKILILLIIYGMGVWLGMISLIMEIREYILDYKINPFQIASNQYWVGFNRLQIDYKKYNKEDIPKVIVRKIILFGVKEFFKLLFWPLYIIIKTVEVIYYLL
jgi:hypothetical protein